MILVVDDDKVLTQLMKGLLVKEGYDVITVHDGETAFEKVKDPSCQCMLLDIHLPGINGVEILMLMATDKIEVPVIVIAGNPDYDEAEMKEFPNVRKLFHKPLYPEELLETVRDIALPPHEA